MYILFFDGKLLSNLIRYIYIIYYQYFYIQIALYENALINNLMMEEKGCLAMSAHLHPELHLISNIGHLSG